MSRPQKAASGRDPTGRARFALTAPIPGIDATQPSAVPAEGWQGRRAAAAAWCLFDWANSAYPTVIITFVFAAYFTQGVATTVEEGTAQWGLMLSLSGLALAVHFATWVTSLTLTSVASATALVSLQLAWVVAWQLLRGERFGVGVVAGLVLAFAGVLVVSGVDLTLSLRALAGDGLALVGGLTAAAYMIVGSRARQTMSTTTYTFVCYGTCSVALAVAALVAGQELTGYDGGQWLLLVAVTGGGSGWGNAKSMGKSPLPARIDRTTRMVLGATANTGRFHAPELATEAGADAYMAREVLPHVPDAWVDYDKTKVGYEIPINRHFYVYKPPRPLDEFVTKIEGGELFVQLPPIKRES